METRIELLLLDGESLTFEQVLAVAYGEPGEDYPVSMENRLDRMPRITVRDVLDKVERWRDRYSASSGPKS